MEDPEQGVWIVGSLDLRIVESSDRSMKVTHLSTPFTTTMMHTHSPTHLYIYISIDIRLVCLSILPISLDKLNLPLALPKKLTKRIRSLDRTYKIRLLFVLQGMVIITIVIIIIMIIFIFHFCLSCHPLPQSSLPSFLGSQRERGRKKKRNRQGRN